ncbi:flagellar hook-length control protein FliK [Thermodesulfobacterium sp. TA1]|uniref:flagellar hook-length control protein FliK n=1 Tax=Thermodesulfobacterium sp. TA1 TaxID=2234087 RepID=UPI0012320F4E|nr:flagellar hook-length control protein FliK [Thermodesulfobacterium sp. TA1]QER41351.1 flagellar hook-length control protein FliK [Thermodesulfobacterium sp. TA1]
MKVNFNPNNLYGGNILLSGVFSQGEDSQDFNFLQLILLYLLANGDPSSQPFVSASLEEDQPYIFAENNLPPNLKTFQKEQTQEEVFPDFWFGMFLGYLADKTGVTPEALSYFIAKEGLPEGSGLTLEMFPLDKNRLYEGLKDLLSSSNLKEDFFGWLNQKIETEIKEDQNIASFLVPFKQNLADLTKGIASKEVSGLKLGSPQEENLEFKGLLAKLEDKLRNEVFTDKRFLDLRTKLLETVKTIGAQPQEHLVANNQEVLSDLKEIFLRKVSSLVEAEVSGKDQKVEGLRLTGEPIESFRGLLNKVSKDSRGLDKSSEVFENTIGETKGKEVLLADGVAFLNKKQGNYDERQGDLTRFQLFYHQVSHLKVDGAQQIKVETIRFLEGEKMSPQFFEFVKRFSAEVLPEGEKRAYVRLEPPHLGSLDLEIKVHEKEVMIVARVEKEEAFRELQANVEAIRESLKELGLSLKDFQTQLNLGTGYQGFDREDFEKKRFANNFGQGLEDQKEDVEVLNPQEVLRNLKGKHYFIV